MEYFLKKIWVVLFAFMIFGILSWVPIDKYQKVYLNEFHRIKTIPQKHYDNGVQYADYIEEGGSPNSRQIAPSSEKLYSTSDSIPKKRIPYFIRDKHNPKILYPYRG